MAWESRARVLASRSSLNPMTQRSPMRALYVIGPPMLTAGVVLLVLLGRCQGSDPVGPDLLMRDLFPPEADPSRCALHLTPEMHVEVCAHSATKSRPCRCVVEIEALDHRAPLKLQVRDLGKTVQRIIRIGEHTSPTALRAGQRTREYWDCPIDNGGCGVVDRYNYAYIYAPEPYDRMALRSVSRAPSAQPGEAP